MKNYRDYLISPMQHSPAMVSIATAGQGGRIPNMLSGAFTSYHEAMTQIDVYLDSVKGKTNGKTAAAS